MPFSASFVHASFAGPILSFSAAHHAPTTRYDSDMRVSSVTECAFGTLLGVVRGSFGALVSVVSAALLVAACGNSSVPSPFVLSDASTEGHDARDSGAGTDGSVSTPASDGSSGRPGEWDGPCVDDRSCDDGAACTTDSCDPTFHRCHFAPNDSACDDGAYCNGVEQCFPVIGCRPGEPVACSDGTACTIDSCDETTKQCLHVPRDADGDGDPDGNCPGGHDCNDTDPSISSLAPEVCGNGIDDNCNGQIDEAGCVSPKYDTCNAPLDVTGSGSFLLSMAATHLDYAASCVKTDSRFHDLAIAVHVPSGDPVDVELVLNGTGGANVGLAAATRCGDASSEIACGAGAVAPDHTPVAGIRLRGLPEGVYPVYVFSDSTGLVTLAVNYVAPEAAPTNETCGTAARLTPGTHADANLVGASVDLSTACGKPFADLVYDFVLDAPHDVRVFAAAKDDAGSPILSLRSANCSDAGSELTCHSDQNDAIYYRALAAGHYYLDVGATGPADIDVVLEVDAPTVPPADENCTGSPKLRAGVTTNVDLTNHVDDIHVGCGIGMPDAAYDLGLPSTSDVLLVMGASSGDSAALSLAKPACDGGSRLACATGSGAPVRTGVQAIPAGDYRVVVESRDSNPVTITAFVRPTMVPYLVPFADGCSDAAEIPETGGSFQGNTANSTNDFTASCDVGGASPSPDQLLHLHLSKARRVVFDTRGSSYATIVDVRSGSTCPGDEVAQACSAGYSSGRSYVDVTLAAGDYWVQIDGYDSSSGPWVLDVFTTE